MVPVTYTMLALLLGGCRLTQGLVNKPPVEEQGQALECESDQPPVSAATEPPPAPTNAPRAAAGTAPTSSVAAKPRGKVRPAASKPAPRANLPRGEIRRVARRVSVGGQTVAVTLLDVPLGSATVKVGLAKGRVGATESLASIARRHGAVAAINGSFFDAYSKRPVRNPYGALITGGQVLYVSDHPTTLGIWEDGTVAIGQVKFHVRGDSGHHDAWLRNWYAYGLNQCPETETCATIYTSRFSQSRSPEHGLYTVVRNGRIVSQGYGSTSIPSDGYVLYIRGAETQLDKRFEVGGDCTYELTAESSDALDWLTAQEALGCGPLLVRNGQASVDPRAERFKDPKVLTNAGNRSAVGLTADGHLLLVTSSAITVAQLGRLMKTLGCQDAMNLDGGASSGLFFRDAYLTRPGRDVANALVVLAR